MYDTITEDSIAELVDSFYSRIRDDRLLGPIFANAIGSDWGAHLDRMKRFWSSVARAEMIGERLLHAISSYHESATRENAEAAQGAL